MKNLKKLISSYKTQAKAKWAIREDMSDMYMQDANDAEVVYNFITESNGVNIPTASIVLFFTAYGLRSIKIRSSSRDIPKNSISFLSLVIAPLIRIICLPYL